MIKNKKEDAITSEKIFEMLEVFERLSTYIRSGREFFDMAQYCVYRKSVWHENLRKNTKEYSCGTVHCFAGWYLIAKHLSDIRDGRFVSGKFKNRNGVRYRDGVKEMVTFFFPNFKPDLEKGYSEDQYLEKIIDNITYEIWGNENKALMFASPKAYSSMRKLLVVTLQDVLDHWGEVGLRFYINELFVEGQKKLRKLM